VANGLGMILLVVFLLGYYAVYQISLPYSNTILEPIAASIVTACAIVSSIKLFQGIKVNVRAWLVSGLAMVLLVLPLVAIITWQEPEAAADDGFPVRIMTYNLHNGFNTDGYLDMEAIAQVIENNNPDIIALQEISRGWVISGRIDMLIWLSQRLNMPYIFGPTADPLWGNAILSRYPILEYKSYDLPPRDLFILRGFTSAVFNLGGDNNLRVIATHFHHLAEDSDIRQMQSTAIIDFWNGIDRTVILGDFNAEPDAPEIDMLRQAGLVDAFMGMEPHTALTYHSANPYQRIDYIWVSPDLEVEEVYVPFSNASDHLPIVVVINN
jgi:endonuclease/exonuclease/phosphatase family metal-dependent hydrolase